MYQVDFFLGLPIDEDLLKHLLLVDSSKRSFFVQKAGDAYLQEVLIGHTTYLGKYVEFPINGSALNLLKNNIYSLLRNLLPDYPMEKIPLDLFPMIKETTSPK